MISFSMRGGDDRRGDGAVKGGYHHPHYVNKVQEHVPIKPQCRAS